MSTAQPKRPYAPRVPAEQRREQLLDATLEIISADGIGAVSIDAVAKRSGVTRPVVYGHFTDSNHMLRVLLERESERALIQITEGLPDDLGDDPVKAFEIAGRGFFDAVQAEPTRWRAMLLPVDAPPIAVRASKNFVDQVVRAQVAGLLRSFLDDKADDVDLLAHLVVQGMQESARLLLQDPQTYSAERLTAMSRFMIESFVLRGRHGPPGPAGS